MYRNTKENYVDRNTRDAKENYVDRNTREYCV